MVLGLTVSVEIERPTDAHKRKVKFIELWMLPETELK